MSFKFEPEFNSVYASRLSAEIVKVELLFKNKNGEALVDVIRALLITFASVSIYKLAEFELPLI